jgi:excisionase family DNA binding protein
MAVATTSSDPAGSPRRLIGITQLAERLGVSIRHVRRLVHERRIPFIKWGHLIRFDPDDIEAWVEAAKVKPQDERPSYPPRTIKPRIGDHNQPRKTTPDRP